MPANHKKVATAEMQL